MTAFVILLLGAQPDEILGEAFDRIFLLRLVALTMSSQFGIQGPTLKGEILHLGRKVRAIPAQAMDEQELRRSRPSDVEGQLDAVTRAFHGHLRIHRHSRCRPAMRRVWGLCRNTPQPQLKCGCRTSVYSPFGMPTAAENRLRGILIGRIGRWEVELRLSAEMLFFGRAQLDVAPI